MTRHWQLLIYYQKLLNLNQEIKVNKLYIFLTIWWVCLLNYFFSITKQLLPWLLQIRVWPDIPLAVLQHQLRIRVRLTYLTSPPPISPLILGLWKLVAVFELAVVDWSVAEIVAEFAVAWWELLPLQMLFFLTWFWSESWNEKIRVRVKSLLTKKLSGRRFLD